MDWTIKRVGTSGHCEISGLICRATYVNLAGHGKTLGVPIVVLGKLDGIAGPLQEHWQLQGRRCMPTKHRDFLAARLSNGWEDTWFCDIFWLVRLNLFLLFMCGSKTLLTSSRSLSGWWTKHEWINWDLNQHLEAIDLIFICEKCPSHRVVMVQNVVILNCLSMQWLGGS